MTTSFSQSRVAAKIGNIVEAGVRKPKTRNSQCINHIGIYENDRRKVRTFLKVSANAIRGIADRWTRDTVHSLRAGREGTALTLKRLPNVRAVKKG